MDWLLKQSTDYWWTHDCNNFKKEQILAYKFGDQESTGFLLISQMEMAKSSSMWNWSVWPNMNPLFYWTTKAERINYFTKELYSLSVGCAKYNAYNESLIICDDMNINVTRP